jgi:hypothetical protein
MGMKAKANRRFAGTARGERIAWSWWEGRDKWGRCFGELTELGGPPRPATIGRVCLAAGPWRRRLRRPGNRIGSLFK